MDYSTIFKSTGDPTRPAKKAPRKKQRKQLKKQHLKEKPGPKTKRTLYPCLSPPPSMHPLSFYSGPQFVILPLHLFPDITHFDLRCIRPTIAEIWSIRLCNKKLTMASLFPPTYPKVLARAVARMHKSRQLFRRFLHRWRASRLRQLNTEDCITLEPIQEPIEIVDWSQRTKTLFEAKSLMRDITERLMLNDGFFEDPQPPRNPMTNLPLTQAQLISVWEQLAKTSVKASWAFTAFRKARYTMSVYLTENDTGLKLNALRKNMGDMKDFDTQERLLDFINYAFEQEAVNCFISTYQYIIKWMPDCPEIQKWQKLCLKFYEAHILFGRQTDRCKAICQDIMDKTIPLINEQRRLVAMKKADWNLYPERRPVPAASQIAPQILFPPLNNQLALDLNLNMLPEDTVDMAVAAAQIADFLNLITNENVNN